MALGQGTRQRKRGILKETLYGFDRFKDPRIRNTINNRFEKGIRTALEEELGYINRTGTGNIIDFKVSAEDFAKDISNHFVSNHHTHEEMKKEARRLVGVVSTGALSENQLKEIAKMEKRVWKSKLEAVDDAIFSFKEVIENGDTEIRRIIDFVTQKCGELTANRKDYESVLGNFTLKVNNLKEHLNNLAKARLDSMAPLKPLTWISLELREIELAEEVIKEKKNVPEI